MTHPLHPPGSGRDKTRALELQTMVRKDFTITENAPTIGPSPDLNAKWVVTHGP